MFFNKIQSKVFFKCSECNGIIIFVLSVKMKEKIHFEQTLADSHNCCFLFNTFVYQVSNKERQNKLALLLSVKHRAIGQCAKSGKKPQINYFVHFAYKRILFVFTIPTQTKIFSRFFFI